MLIHRKLDLKGEASALAVENTARALGELSRGELIEVLATDPGSIREFDSWSRSSGNALLESSQLGNVFRFVVRKA